ncbi:MAG TPA: Hsp20/alpha crystallin family protein [Candidatus Paceibacterota bacterium]|nr:Hsp20/alpha crystallin family protein [Candidatus Paceibacterota bacterium]
MLKKPSFFAKLSGADTDDFYDDVKMTPTGTPAVFKGTGDERHAHISTKNEKWDDADEMPGELAVDVYQTPDAIVIKAFIAGVQPNSVDIALTRESITISGSRADDKEVEEDGYYQRELYWGAFSRTIILPEEIDVDLAEASEKHGILMVRLPKINKAKQTKLKVRSR